MSDGQKSDTYIVGASQRALLTHGTNCVKQVMLTIIGGFKTQRIAAHCIWGCVATNCATECAYGEPCPLPMM